MNKFFKNVAGDPSSIGYLHSEKEEDFLEPPEDFGNGVSWISTTFVFDVIMLIFIPIPYYDRYIIIECTGKDTVFMLSEFMLVFMCLRIYFLIRSMLNYSEFMDPFAKKVC